MFISSPFNPFSHELKAVNGNKEVIHHIVLIVDLEFQSALVLLIHDCVPMNTTSPMYIILFPEWVVRYCMSVYVRDNTMRVQCLVILPSYIL